jgi:CheY-like chemotaxis protein
MDAETVSRIFEPFFTTKPHGAGTGLGLAMVYGIVKQAGGIVTVDTAPGQGATFRLYFPLIAEEGAAERRAQQHAPSPGGTELVLVCEDEPSVRLVMATTLRSAGYRVLEAESAEAALELVAAMPEPLDALVTDMVMPGMNGRQLAERLRLKYPALACLLVSGYLGHGDQAGSSGGDGLPQLQKPFTPQTLLARVRQLIRNRA